MDNVGAGGEGFCWLVGFSLGFFSWFVVGVFLFVLGFFLTDCYQLFIYFQEAGSAKGSILLSYLFAFTII